MSKLGKLLGKPEEVEIQGEKLMIHPLKVKDLQLFLGKEDASPEEQMNLSKTIIKKSLIDDEPSDDEIDNMNTESFTKLMDAINQVNGFKDEKSDKLAKLKERLVRQGKQG